MNEQRISARLPLRAVLLLSAPVWLVSCASSPAEEAQQTARAQQIAGEAPQSSGEALQEIAITVHKRTNCSCCTKWVEHLKEHGFIVTATEEPEPELQAIKERLGVPSSLRSCHTATVNGYVIEGHVPADVIRRHLAEAPQMTGLSVPEMVVGSPGMEMEGHDPQPYDIVAFDRNGNQTVYERRDGTAGAQPIPEDTASK